VSIFRRGKSSEQAETGAEAPAVAEAEAADNEVDIDRTGSESPAAAEDAGAEADANEVSAAGHDGPYDASEVDSSVGRLDLGALWVVGVPGMELRLEVEETTQNVVGATAVLEDSAVQLQAYAAPKSMGIWDDIRAEIAESIVAQGGTADETRGALGTELRTRMPSAGPDGRTVFAPARFVGVDGPRWFLRAVFSGRAAIDEDAAQTLMQVVRGTVVVRGDAAMAPRELLPLRLPEEVAASQAEDDESGAGASTDDLKPFERGPEITEVR
jgi:hypothetical protein